MNRVLVPVACAVVLGSSGHVARAQPADTILLVEDGQPRATILLAEEPTVSAQLAAYELQYHLEKMSGATLPIAREPANVTGTMVLVGESEATRALGYQSDDFEHSEYLIEASADRLVLIGRDHARRGEVDYDGDLRELIVQMAPDPLGTCYAVHTFLERSLGVRWYLPTELGEVIPERATVEIEEMKSRRKVDAPYRTPYVPWAVNKQLHYSDYQEVEWNYDDHWDLRSGVLYWIRNKQWGGPVVWANHSFDGWGEAFGEDHPEWFSTKSWEKMQQVNYQLGVQPCLSNPEVFEKNLEIIRSSLDGKPAPFAGAYYSAKPYDGGTFGMGLNDGGAYCYCEDCVALDRYRSDPAFGIGIASDYFWSYVSRLGHEVRQTHPEANLIGIAYMGYTAPPRGIKFAPNVSVMYCRFPHRYWREDYKQRDYEEIHGFVEDCGARGLFTWDYVIHPPGSSHPFPPIIPCLVAEDAKYMTALPNFRGGFMQIPYQPVEKEGVYEWADNVWLHPVVDHFRVYFRLKVWDDKTVDVDELLGEYFAKFYGPAAAEARAFVEALESRWRHPTIRLESGTFPPMGPHHYGDDTAQIWWERLGAPEFIDQLQTLMTAAQEAAPAGSVYARRVDLLDRGIMQLILNNRLKHAQSDLGQLPPIPEIDVTLGPAPTVDGRGDDPVWQTAPWQTITRTEMNQEATADSRFRAVADRDALYLLVECAESLTENLVVHGEGGGPAVLSGDSLEIFLDEDPTDGRCFHLGYDTRGGIYESLTDTGADAEAGAGWRSGSRARTTVTPNESWTAEIAIPWQNLTSETVADGKTWRINVCRNRWADGGEPEYTNWSVCGGAFHTPARFGRMTIYERGK